MLADVVKARGGILHISRLPPGWLTDYVVGTMERLACHADWVARNLYENSNRRIIVDLIDSREPFAFSYASDYSDGGDFDFIGISLAMIFNHFDLFSRIFANPESFPEWGDSNKEEAGQELPYLARNVLKFGGGGNGPKCLSRANFATQLAAVATDHVFFHEVGHLKNGHLELKKMARDGYIETDGGEKIGVNIIYQTLEWDADHCAFYLGLGALIRSKYNLLADAANLGPDQLYAALVLFASERGMLTTLALAAHVIFRMEDHGNWMLEEQVAQNYPLPPVRLWMIHESLETIAADWPNLNLGDGEIDEICGTAFRAAESSCANLVGGDPNYDWIYAVIRNNDINECLRSLRECWGKIRPLLLPNIRGKSIPE